MATQNQLQRAIEEGDKRTFARLIHDGVDVNVRLTVDGDTLLFKAIREDQEDIVRLLISEGADVTARDKDWLEPVHTAARYGNVNIMDMLLRGGAEVNRSSEGLNMNALFLAVKWQQTDMVRHLLSSGADCRLKVGQGQKADTAFHYCIKNKDAEMMNLLLSAGVPVNITDGKLQTPLHTAAATVSTDGAMIKRLLDCGADARAGDLSGDTPMHVAVLHGHAVAIKALYMAGADLDRLNNKQLTPSHLAVSMGRLEAIRLLIQLGANVDKPGLDDLTPLLYCHATLVLNLCYPLWEGTCSQEPIGELCTTHHRIHMSVLDELIEAGCDVNHADVSGRRLLNYLVKGGVQSEAAVRRLLIEGADHDMCTIRGTTLLMVAALSRHNPTTRLVLRFCPSLVAYTPAYPPAALTPPFLSVSALVATARYRDVELITQMLDSGYRPVKQELNMMNQEEGGATPVTATIKQLVEGALRDPRSLLMRAKVVVRNILNRRLHKRVKALEIPNRLKDLLLLEDVLGT